MAVAAQLETVHDRLAFKVKPRLLTLLGDQLIRDANLAVFELVKNAYDADATECSVTLDPSNGQSSGRIVIQDDGVGMDAETLRNVWMMIATDFRAAQRQHNVRSERPAWREGAGPALGP
jgi:hypothetical protein